MGIGDLSVLARLRWLREALVGVCGLGEELLKIGLPDGGVGVGAVAEGLFGSGQEDEPAAFHALDFAFGDAEFGRVDEIVGGVDVHDVGLDGFEFGGGIVIARGIDGVEKIVGVESGGEACHGGGKIFIGGIAGGEIFLHVEGSAAGDDQKIGGDLQGGARLRGVVAIFPVGILADAVHHHFAPDAVASGNLHRLAREGHQGVHEIGVGFAPNPGMHAAHGSAEDQAKVVDAQSFFDEFVLEGDHVRIFVAGEMCMEAVAGLAGFAVADVVGKNQEIFVGVEQLAGAEEGSREDGLKKRVAFAAGAVEDQDGVGGAASGVFDRFAEGAVVEAEFGERLAGLEMEIVDGEVAFLGRGPVLRGRR